jgi:uncharacterized protein involved in outer membrane biogenesis
VSRANDDSTARELLSKLDDRAGGGFVKKALIVGATVLAVLIAAVVVLPGFVDLGQFKSTYLPLIEETLQRRIDVGEVRLTLVPTPSIRLSKLKVSGTPALPAETFFAAQEVQLRLKFWPLLRGRFEITEFVLDRPVFTLQRQTTGSSRPVDFPGKKAPQSSRQEVNIPIPANQQDSGGIALIIPNRLRVKDGQLNIMAAGRTPVRIHGIGLSVEEFSSEKPFPYRATFDYPGLKTVTLTGQLDYKDERATLNLQNNRVRVHNLTLPLHGSISNLATAPRFNLVLADENVDARPVMQILAVFGLAPADTEISGPMGLRIAVSGPSNNLMTQIQGQFKNVKLYGKRAIKGNLDGAVSLRLAVGGGSDVIQQLQGNGKLSAREGELTNVDLVKKIQRATGVIGFSEHQRREATTFKTLDTEFTLGNGVVDFKRIYLVNPQLELNGGGTMTLARQALNIGMDATLSPHASSKASRGRTSELFKNQRGQLVVPLTVTGDAQNPAVNLDSGKLARRGATRSMEKSLGTFFRQLFRR